MRSQCHRIKDWTTDETFQALQEQHVMWERGAPVGADFGLFIFQDLLNTQELYIYNILQRREKRKKNSLMGLI